jgi:hypothetical protein
MTYMPHSSFNEEGQLVAGSIVGGEEEDGFSSQTAPFISAPSYPAVSQSSSFFKSAQTALAVPPPASLFLTNQNTGPPNPFVVPSSKNSFGSSSLFKPVNNQTKTSGDASNSSSSTNIFLKQPSSLQGSTPVFGGSSFSGFQSSAPAVFPPQEKSEGPSDEEVCRMKEQYLTEKMGKVADEIMGKVVKKDLMVIAAEAVRIEKTEKEVEARREAERRIVNELAFEYAQKVSVVHF